MNRFLHVKCRKFMKFMMG